MQAFKGFPPLYLYLLFVAARLLGASVERLLGRLEASRAVSQMYKTFGIQALHMPNYLLSGESFL